MNFMIPGLYEHHKVLFDFLLMKQKHPEYFLDNVNIGAVYGNFQFCIWDGGRIFQKYTHTSKEKILFIKEQYNEVFHVPMRFVFTNTEIEEKHCYDRFCNMVLKECENDMNEIVVNSPILEAYIRKNYPKYKIISSTTKCLSKIEDFKAEISNKNYKYVCLDYNLNKNEEMLKTLSLEEKERCEFLVNAICPPSCPSRKEHYKLNSLFYLSYGRPYRTRTCGIKTNTLYPNLHFKNNLSPNECQNYSKKGFNNFKLEGRTLSQTELICNLVKYMIKPEYQLYVITGLNGK